MISRSSPNRAERKSFLIALTAAFVIGVYDGFYGPGTGTFLILILTGAAKYTMKEAAGTTKAINLSSNLAAIVTFIINGKVVYPLGLAAGVCCILGNYIGSGMVLSNGQKIVRPMVLVVLVILFFKIIFGFSSKSFFSFKFNISLLKTNPLGHSTKKSVSLFHIY